MIKNCFSNSLQSLINYFMNISPSYKADRPTKTPAHHDELGEMLSVLKLDNNQSKNTLTGIIRCIEDGLGELVRPKRQCGGVDGGKQQVEIDKLVKIQSKVDQLKNIIVLNINQIFSSMYPNALEIKHEHRTHHTQDSNTNRSNNSSTKSMTITDFEQEATHQNIDNINSISINNDTIKHHPSKYYSNGDGSSSKRKDDDVDNSEKKIDRVRDEGYITPFDLGDIQKCQIIQIEDEGDDFPDLICYQNQIANDKKRVINDGTDKQSIFSPIYERPLQEECSIEKALIQNRTNMELTSKLEQKLKSTAGDQIKKKLFSYNGQVKLKRMSTKKFNYLEQF